MTPVEDTNCETDSIRIPGAIQPHGALLVLAAENGAVEAASDSCLALLGDSAQSLLGRRLDKIFGSQSAAALLTGPFDGLQPLVHLSLHGNELRARSCSNGAGQILVDIETSDHDFSSVQGTVYKRRQVLTGLRRMSDIAEIAQETAELIRGMTGFDRVMVYRFDDAWNGEVIGEARAGDVRPFLGLSFPASDIPRQARELFMTSNLRQIPDVFYAPSALLARSAVSAIDLGRSSLRSVAPTHIEYLKNMKIRASLAGALIVEGRLWGLVSCQHESGPKYFGPSVRDALGWLFEDIAALLEATLTRQRREREYSLALRRRRLVDTLRRVDLKELMNQAESTDLLAVVGADGFALVAGNTIQVMGCTPGPERIRDLHKRRLESDGNPTLFASSALVRDLAVAESGDGVAGAVFVSLRDRPDVTMIWFRRERRFSVNWGGDPANMRLVDANGRVSPRKSFAQVQQEVGGQCVAWTAEELDSAAELGSLIEIEALKQREAFVQTVLNSSPEPIAILDTQAVIVSVNDAWKRSAEVGARPGEPLEAVGQRYQDASASAAGQPRGDGAAQAWAGIESVLGKASRFFTLDYSCETLGGCSWFRMSVYPLIAPGEGVVVAHEDITLRRMAAAELEKHRHHLEKLVEERTAALQLAHEAAEAAHLASAKRLRMEADARMQSGKLEAVGTLAAGMAHDFNTILGSIVGFAEMTADEVAEDSIAQRNIAQILSASFRARDLIARVLAFARQSPPELAVVDVVAQVKEALALLSASLPSTVQLAFASGIDESGPPAIVLADPTQIQQIVMNLCINAAHAMEDRGTIHIRVDPAYRIKDVPAAHSESTCLTVTDSGTGMSPEVVARMFDPFFTTKAPSKGSGLGLSVVYGVVTDLGGIIEVRSRTDGSDAGTEFRIFLPGVSGAAPSRSSIGEC